LDTKRNISILDRKSEDLLKGRQATWGERKYGQFHESGSCGLGY